MTRQVFELGRAAQGGLSTFLYVVAFAIALVLVILIYRRDVQRLPRGVSRLLLGLRLAAWVLLVVVFWEPQLRLETTVERPSRTVVAIDNSLSMTLTSGVDTSDGGPTTRSEAAEQAIEESSLLPQLRATQEVPVYSIGRSLQLVETLALGTSDEPSEPKEEQKEATTEPAAETAKDPMWERLAPIADETRLGEGISQILRENRGYPLAGIILFTDGQNNAGPSVERSAKLAEEAKVPVYTVGLGLETPPANLRITELRVPSRAFKGDELRGQAFLQGSGLAGKRVPVEILLESADEQSSPTLLELIDIDIPEDESPVAVTFKYLPEQTGSWQILVRTPSLEGELREDDNAAIASFDVIDQKTRVLLLAGGPSREYRFLRNLLFRDESIEVSVHLQSASATAAQEADQQLVELPQTKESLFRFDVVVAIDPDWSTIPLQTQSLVEEWVAEQSGGLILIAGPVNTPRFARTDLSPGILALYPVVLKEVFTSDFDAGRYSEPWQVDFTRDGELANYLRLDEDPKISRDKWDEFTGVYWCYPVSAVKPAATVLANYSDPRSQGSSGPPPLIATQFFGSGRVLYLGTGEIWRLRQLGEGYYDRFWIRLIREMSQSRLLRGSSRAVILVEGDRFPLGSNLPARAQVLGTDYRPIATSVVPMSVVTPKGKRENVELQAMPGRAGLFEANVPLRLPGEYRLQLLVPDTAEVVERRIVAEVPEREFADPRLNRPLLEALASQTGGKLVALEDLGQIPGWINDLTETTVLAASPKPLWDNVWVLLVIVGLLGAEWLIRKLVFLA